LTASSGSIGPIGCYLHLIPGLINKIAKIQSIDTTVSSFRVDRLWVTQDHWDWSGTSSSIMAVFDECAVRRLDGQITIDGVGPRRMPLRPALTVMGL
jgi:hypothetical protein